MVVDVPSIGDSYYNCDHRAWAIVITVILIALLVAALADEFRKRRDFRKYEQARARARAKRAERRRHHD